MSAVYKKRASHDRRAGTPFIGAMGNAESRMNRQLPKFSQSLEIEFWRKKIGGNTFAWSAGQVWFSFAVRIRQIPAATHQRQGQV